MKQFYNRVRQVALSPVPRECYKSILFLLIFLAAVSVTFAWNSEKPQSEEARAEFTDGNNVRASYISPIHNGKKYHFDGGLGMDVLSLQVTPSEYRDPKFLADIIRFQFYLVYNMNPHSRSGNGETFAFSMFDLTIKNVEILEVELVEEMKAAQK